MKNRSLSALLTMLSVSIASAQAPANANFTATNGKSFTVMLDGQLLAPVPVPQAHAEQVSAGQHWAEFTIPGASNTSRLRTKIWLEPSLETSYVLVLQPNGAPTLRKVAAVPLARLGGGNNYGQGNQNNPAYPNTPGSPNGLGYQNNPGYYNDQGTDPTSPGYNGRNNPPYPGNAPSVCTVMSSQDFNALIDAVSKRPFEASKLSTAKEALSQNSIRADDLKRLLRTLEFEVSRVELAKFAYPHVADRQNFYRIYEAFDYDSSVQEVQQAIGVPRG